MELEKSQDVQSAIRRPSGTNDGNSRLILSPKAGEDPCSSSKTVREKEFFLTSLFILFRCSIDWMRPTHVGEGNLLYSAY